MFTHNKKTNLKMFTHSNINALIADIYTLLFNQINIDKIILLMFFHKTPLKKFISVSTENAIK